MVDIAAGPPVAAGFSGLACPRCDYRFTHRQACGVESLQNCPGCDLLNDVPTMTLRPTRTGMKLLTDRQARNASWFHITHRRHWLENVVAGNVPVYVGTELAALTRARDAQLRAVGKPYWWLYELMLAKNTSFLPGVEPDREDNWITSLDDFESFAGEEIDAVRYFNGYEDPGSIQLLVDPNFLQVARVTLITTSALEGHLLRSLAQREREDGVSA